MMLRATCLWIYNDDDDDDGPLYWIIIIRIKGTNNKNTNSNHIAVVVMCFFLLDVGEILKKWIRNRNFFFLGPVFRLHDVFTFVWFVCVVCMCVRHDSQTATEMDVPENQKQNKTKKKIWFRTKPNQNEKKKLNRIKTVRAS